MKNRDIRLILVIALFVILAYLVLRFLGSIPFSIWVLIAAIFAYLNWPKIKKALGHL